MALAENFITHMFYRTVQIKDSCAKCQASATVYDEDFAILGCHAAYVCSCLPTFLSHLQGCPETSGNDYLHMGNNPEAKAS